MPFYWLMRTYNRRRFAAMARGRRLNRQAYGKQCQPALLFRDSVLLRQHIYALCGRWPDGRGWN